MFHREAGVFKTSYAADMALYPLPIAKWTMAALAGLFIVIAPLFFSEYIVSILNLILIAIVGALGLNILVGYTGQISIGHGAFMSVGAYTAAHLVVSLHLPFWLTIPAGGCMAAVVGTVVGIPSLRIKGIYLAIATLAAQLIIEWTINHVPWISGGSQASIEFARPSVFGIPLVHERQIYLFLLFFVVIAMVATLNLVRSRIGRAFIAIRDQDIAAEIIGINIFRYKLYAFAISSFYAGVAGALESYYLGIANYEQFQIDTSIDYLAMVIIGGLGSVLGSVLGAIFVTLLPIASRWLLEGLGDLFSAHPHLLTVTFMLWSVLLVGSVLLFLLGLVVFRSQRVRESRGLRLLIVVAVILLGLTSVFYSHADLLNVIPNLRLILFGGLIIFFLVVEPEGLNRLWRNIRNYFRVWPFSY
jgi:branched-chain amino acid transport system permease protein